MQTVAEALNTFTPHFNLNTIFGKINLSIPKGRNYVEEALKEIVPVLHTLLKGQEVINAKLDTMELRLSRIEGILEEMIARVDKMLEH